MLTDDYSPSEILAGLDPASCTYQEWVNVGMALRQAGESCSVWDDWSRRDPARYHEGECFTKWASFTGAAYRDITMGTVIQMAMERGWSPGAGQDRAIGWDEEFTESDDPLKVIDQHWVMEEEVPGPHNFNPVQEILQYLEALFSSDEHVGYVVEAYSRDQDDPDKPTRYVPTKGRWDQTAGELMQALYACHGDVGAVMGDINKPYGAWIRFNPLDGKGISDSNVTAYRFALVECDTLPISKQYALIKQLQLPVAVLVHSGKKSLHAICRIDAASFSEYRAKVDYLYKVCEKNGLKLDTNNRNPSRLSRLPGAMRDGVPQYIVATNIGCESFDDWKEYIESLNDNLPDIGSLSEVFANPPELAPELISGILRKGHKMLLSGPSKAGKSFALIELCIAIAEGIQWLGFKCSQGRVLYVNLELDPCSCYRRFVDVYKALGMPGANVRNIDIWNLRGRSEPMDKLAPKLIRRCRETEYAAIIIDPIYKVITGDENSADQMAAFCNQFDRVASELGCSVIYCHHHSKGSQAAKRASDRASGSGVFSRDPDAIIDMLEIDVKDEDRDALVARSTPKICYNALQYFRKDSYVDLLQGVDLGSVSAMVKVCHDNFTAIEYKQLDNAIIAANDKIEARTGWRIEGTLREFRPFQPVFAWFAYPVHLIDTDGILDKKSGAAAAPVRGTRKGSIKEYKDKELKQNEKEFAEAMEITGGNIKEMVKYFDDELSERALRARAKRYGYCVECGVFVKMEMI